MGKLITLFTWIRFWGVSNHVQPRTMALNLTQNTQDIFI